jgi:hypothetical protein
LAPQILIGYSTIIVPNIKNAFRFLNIFTASKLNCFEEFECAQPESRFVDHFDKIDGFEG